MTAVIDTNETSKSHISEMIIKRQPKIVGVYRLTMKFGSDNFRESAVHGVMKKLLSDYINVIIFESTLKVEEYGGYKIINELDTFKQYSDVIIVNRFNEELVDVKDKINTRDVFHRDLFKLIRISYTFLTAIKYLSKKHFGNEE